MFVKYSLQMHSSRTTNHGPDPTLNGIPTGPMVDPQSFSSFNLNLEKSDKCLALFHFQQWYPDQTTLSRDYLNFWLSHFPNEPALFSFFISKTGSPVSCQSTGETIKNEDSQAPSPQVYNLVICGESTGS